MRGQTAIEFLVCFSALLIFLATGISRMATPVQEAASNTLFLSQGREAVELIGEAIDTVYSNGEGTIRSVNFKMDESWSLTFDHIQNVVCITLKTSQGEENLEKELNYDFENFHALFSLPSGSYLAVVEWSENSENINIDFQEKKIFIEIHPAYG